MADAAAANTHGDDADDVGSAGEGPSCSVKNNRVCPPPYKKPTEQSLKELMALFQYTIQVRAA